MKKKQFFLAPLLLVALMMSACNAVGPASNNESKPTSEESQTQESSKPVDNSGFVFDDNELNTPQEIHTADQLAYLNFEREYYTINGDDLNGFNARGNTNVSTPLPVKITFDFEPDSSKTLKNYSLIFSQNEDLSDPYEVRGTLAKEFSFYNSFLGTNYFKVVANYDDDTLEESDVKTY